MPTALEYFRLVATEFVDKTDEQVQSFLDMSPMFINIYAYQGETQNLAIAYKAASLMFDQKLATSGNSSGQDVKSEKEGDLARSYGSINSAMMYSGRAKNLYEHLLSELSKANVGATIMTRFGSNPATYPANSQYFNNWLAFEVSFNTYGIN